MDISKKPRKLDHTFRTLSASTCGVGDLVLSSGLVAVCSLG